MNGEPVSNPHGAMGLGIRLKVERIPKAGLPFTLRVTPFFRGALDRAIRSAHMPLPPGVKLPSRGDG